MDLLAVARFAVWAGFIASLAYLAFALSRVLAWRPGLVTLPADPPGVTVAKPLCGLEAEMEENRRSWMAQDYPRFQVVFGVRDADDPAIPFVREVMADFPAVDATLVVHNGKEPGTGERLRFDFTHFQSIDPATIEAIEDEINGNILKNISVDVSSMETRKAIESGVTALFGEKYGNVVRVVTVPEVSSELCGGTHVHATGDIGLLKIISEGSVAAGIRRIEAVTGKAALSFFREKETELNTICDHLKITEKPAEKVARLLADMRDLEKDLASMKDQCAAEGSTKIVSSARDINGVKVVAYRTDGVDAKDLRTIADNVRVT